MKSSTFFAASAVLVSQLAGVVAHGGVLSYSNAGNWYWGWQPYNTPTGQTSIQRPWSSYNPIQNMTDPTIACNDNGAAGALQLTAPNIEAGSSITAYWNVPWPHNTGPVLTYLSLCPSSGCTNVNTATAQWFKIQEAGLINGTIYSGTWAAGVMIAQNSTWTTVIPATIPPGQYLIRFETIALHSMPAQSYPECAQIQIVGGSNPTPAPADILVTFPGAYNQNDPGLNIDIYDQEAEVTYNYTIPGPPLYAGGTGSPSSGTPPPPPPPTSSSSPSAAPTTSAKPTTSSAKPPATSTSSSAAPTTTASGATAPLYGQCGGIGWTGATICVAGSTCTVSNSYYSQCLP